MTKLRSSGSQLGAILPPRGHSAMSGDIDVTSRQIIPSVKCHACCGWKLMYGDALWAIQSVLRPQRVPEAKLLFQGGRSVCVGVTDLVITRRRILLEFGEQGLGMPVSPHNKELSHTRLECPTDIYIVKNLFIITWAPKPDSVLHTKYWGFSLGLLLFFFFFFTWWYYSLSVFISTYTHTL